MHAPRGAALRLAAAPLAAAASCRHEGLAPVGSFVALAALHEGDCVQELRGDESVELLRRSDVVRARSFWCNHGGCEVRRMPARDLYRCPCHGAIFDADGRVLQGPQPAPLREVAVTRDGDRIVIPPLAADGPPRPRRAVPPPAGDRA